MSGRAGTGRAAGVLSLRPRPAQTRPGHPLTLSARHAGPALVPATLPSTANRFWSPSPPVTLPTAKPSKSKPVKSSKRKSISGASRPLRLPIVAYGRVSRSESGGRAALDRADTSDGDRRHCATRSIWICRQRSKARSHGRNITRSGAVDHCRCGGVALRFLPHGIAGACKIRWE